MVATAPSRSTRETYNVHFLACVFNRSLYMMRGGALSGMVSCLSHPRRLLSWVFILAVFISSGSAASLTFTPDYGVAYFDSGVSLIGVPG